MSEVLKLDDYRASDSGVWVPPYLTESEDAVEDAAGSVAQQVSSCGGKTKVVARRERDNAEARRLVELQAEDVAEQLDTRKVRKARQHGVQARKLHALRQQPEAVALRDARVRLWTTVMALLAAVAALGWSTASVQHTAAAGAPVATAGWLLSFLVEPLISLGLLAVIGVQAYAAMRGAVLDPNSEHGATLKRTQHWLLALTVTLNTWPYLAPLWGPGSFDLIQVVVHLVGPIVAVRMIHSLPAMWAAIEQLALPTAPPDRGVTPPECSDNATAAGSGSNPSRADAIAAELQRLLASGEWTKNVSVPAIRGHFGCGVAIAREVRDRIGTNRSTGGTEPA